MKVLISVGEAQDIMLSSAAQLQGESVYASDAVGRTLAQEVCSLDNLPPFDNSAMDGYAVIASDVPGRLRIMETVQAGITPQVVVRHGTCSRIMTGAPIPKGADSVVQVEKTRKRSDGTVLINGCTQPLANIRPMGADIRAGDTVLARGLRVTPPMVGMLCALGVSRVTVTRRPRVAVISTGDELVDVDAPLAPAKIRDSNGPGLAALVVAAGAEVQAVYRALDNKESIRCVVREALVADMLLFSGGVSVGEYDLVKAVLEEMGMQMLFWKVRQRPGKPLAFGVLQEKPIVGLPGNPVSSAICFDQYVRPMLGKMLGRSAVFRKCYEALLQAPVRKRRGFHTFVRGIAEFDNINGLQARTTGSQASNVYSSMVRANCIIHLPEVMESAPVGTQVKLEWLHW